MAQGCLDRLRYLKLAEILSKIFYSLPGLWLPLRKGVYLPQFLHHLCQPGVGIVASPNHLLRICVQVPELLPSGALLEPVFRKNFDHSGFLPLGRPTHCGRKKKIIMDYIGIAWLKCYQLCVAAGSSVTAGRKGSKMPTLLVEKAQFVKFKSAFRPESRVILIKGMNTACWETKTIGRLGWQGRSQSLQPPASHILQHWAWIWLSRSEQVHKAAAFGGTEALVGR